MSLKYRRLTATIVETEDDYSRSRE